MSFPVIDMPLCDGSRACVDVCPVGVFEMTGGKAVVKTPEDCTGCQACVAACLQSCIAVQDS